MHRVWLLLALLAGTGLVLPLAPPVAAQDATPAVEDFAPEGITYEPVAFARGLALPGTNDLSLDRITFEPEAGFTIDAGDPQYALVVVERGEFTIRLEGPLQVTRGSALETAMEEMLTGGEFAPATAEIAAGQEVTLRAGDAALFPPNAGGEVGNTGQDAAVVLVAFVGPPAAMTAGTPTP
jgi:hypothetical protein